eukprot:COSAG01_NODE_461_length_16698_cov_113.458160_18_plen_111_part_00
MICAAAYHYLGGQRESGVPDMPRGGGGRRGGVWWLLHLVDSVRVPGRADAVAELSLRLGAARTDSERAECVPPRHVSRQPTARAAAAAAACSPAVECVCRHTEPLNPSFD